MSDRETGEVSALSNGPRVTVVITGEVDMLTTPHLDDVLTHAVDSCQTGVDVDLSQVSFMGSTAFRSLVLGRNRAEARGVDLVVVRASDWARRLLVTAGLEDLLMPGSPSG